MSLIEQATRRMEELRRAGVEVPWSADGQESRHPDGRDVAHAAPEAPKRVATPTENPEPLRRGRRPDAAGFARVSATVNLDLDLLAQSGYLVPAGADSELAQEFRYIKRPLLQNAWRDRTTGDARAPFIMVTSALPGEGKTYCAINLAMSMAMEVDSSVLLVDADVLRPSVLGRLGLAPARGLLDLLTDPKLALADVVLATNVPKLSILASGTSNRASTELLASAAMDRLLARLAEEYADHVVVFDSPPLLLTTEAPVLASHLGQVVMVVSAAGTPSRAVADAFATVETCPIVMSVLNKCTEAVKARRYGYYYA